MASGIGRDNLKNLCECPVCFEPYNDPRLLTCGHQFCEGCLKDVIKQQPHAKIPCPVCREVTAPKLGDVTSLPRSTLHQYMQELIFQQPKQEALGQTCTKCNTEKPTRHCPDCKADLAYLCDRCFGIHQKVPRFASHKTVPFDPMLVCSVHSHKMVECYCHDCNQVACDDCLFEIHGEHNIENLKDVAERSRHTLREYISKHEDQVIDQEIIGKLRNSMQQLEASKTTFKGKVDRVKQAWKTLESKLDKTMETMNSTVDNEVNKVSNFQMKLTEIAASQDKMLSLADSLLGDAADTQVITGSKNLPDTNCDLSEAIVKTPIIGSQFDKMADDINAMHRSADVKFMKTVLPVKKGGRKKASLEMNLKHIKTIQCKHAVFALRFDPNSKKILTRARDSHELVMAYSTDGATVKMLGKDGPPTPYQDNFFREIDTDTKRDLHLLPCVNGTLLRIEASGKVKDAPELGSNLFGVAYLKEKDLYVVSDSAGSESKVMLVSPETLKVTQTLGNRGTFTDPRNICVGNINGSPTIVIIDKVKNTIDLYSLSGQLLRTFGPSIPGHEPLKGPRGAAVDAAGRILICDYVVARVIRVWGDSSGEHWECLLGKEEFDHQPWCLDIDNVNRLVAVKGENKIQLYKY